MREPPMRPPSLMNSHRCKRIPETEDEQKKRGALLVYGIVHPKARGIVKR